MKYKDIKDYELITAYPIPGIFFKFGKEQSKIDEYVILYNKYRKMITQYIISEIMELIYIIEKKILFFEKIKMVYFY